MQVLSIDFKSVRRQRGFHPRCLPPKNLLPAPSRGRRWLLPPRPEHCLKPFDILNGLEAKPINSIEHPPLSPVTHPNRSAVADVAVSTVSRRRNVKPPPWYSRLGSGGGGQHFPRVILKGVGRGGTLAAPGLRPLFSCLYSSASIVEKRKRRLPPRPSPAVPRLSFLVNR